MTEGSRLDIVEDKTVGNRIGTGNQLGPDNDVTSTPAAWSLQFNTATI